MSILRRLAISAVSIGVALSCAIAISQSAPAFLLGAGECRASATRMARLELLFGMSRPDGRTIANDEWQAFIDTEVTPRFPEGLTVMAGSGQWLGRAGAIAKEQSHLLIVWYRTAADSESKIEAIRNAYKARFSQESVMRVDSSSCVSF